MDTNNHLLSVNEVAGRLGVSVACIYGLVASKELACYRVGQRRGVIRISPEQLQAYLNKTTAQTPEMPAPAPPRPKVNLKHLQL